MAYSNDVAMVIVCNSDSLKVLHRITNQIHGLKSVLEKTWIFQSWILRSSDPQVPRAVPQNGASYCCGHHEPGIPAISPSQGPTSTRSGFSLDDFQDFLKLPALLGFTIPCALHC